MALITKTGSPVRPDNFVVPANTSGILQNFFASRAMHAHGLILQTLTVSGANPTAVYIGFNKQPPVLFQIRDAYHIPPGNPALNTVEVYNTYNTPLSVTLVYFDGQYIPSPSSASIIVSGIGSGVFLPVATSNATLKALPTVGLTTGTVVEFVNTATAALQAWILTANATSPADSPGLISPSDYNAGSNARVWIQAL